MDWVTKGIGKFIQGKESPRLQFIQVPMPGNESQILSLVFRIYDKSMTAHQLERTKNNRYLITESEQQRLLGCRVGIIGLTTGSVILEALLRQGVGGIYRLADIDKFEVPDGNRMLFTKADVGLSKLDFCKERVELYDSDLVVEAFPEGISKDNVSEFVRDCDIVIEECDDFLVKVLVRKEAMKHKKPVLMATSLNGMIHIERYDIDDKVKPFHLKDVKELSLLLSSDLTAQAKAEILQKIFDVNVFSTLFKQLSMEVGQSVSSLPQVAEEVFLSAATLTHLTRRVLLGDTGIVSGRFSFDLGSMFKAEKMISTSNLRSRL